MIQFENIPGAGLVAPIMALELTSGGQFENDSKFVFIGHKTTEGTMSLNQKIACGSVLEAMSLAGPGSMLVDMFRLGRLNAPTQEIQIMAVADAGAAAVWQFTAPAAPTAGGVGLLYIQGEPVTVQVEAGDAQADVATKLAAAINNYFNEQTDAALCVTAAASATAVTITARHKGEIFDDLDIWPDDTVASNFLAGLSITKTTAGTGAPDLSSAYAALGDDNADIIVSPWEDDANIDRAKVLTNDLSGRWSYGRFALGHVVTTATGNTAERQTAGQRPNDRHLTLIERPSGVGDFNPRWQWATAMISRLAHVLFDGSTGGASINHSGFKVQGLRAPRRTDLCPDYAARNAALKSGLSTWICTGDGGVAIDKLITTYRTNPLGQPDTVFRDIQYVGQMTVALRKFKADYAAAHGNKAIADDNPGALGNISTTLDIKATLISTAEELSRGGVLENVDAFAQLVVVRRDGTNANRVNAFSPLDRVNPLDIFAQNAQLYSQYRQAQLSAA